MESRSIVRGLAVSAGVVVCGMLVTRCGGSSPSAPSNTDTTITLTAAGLVPTEVRIAAP